MRFTARIDGFLASFAGITFMVTGSALAVASGVAPFWAVLALPPGAVIGGLVRYRVARRTIAQLVSGNVVRRISGWRKWLLVVPGPLGGVLWAVVGGLYLGQLGLSRSLFILLSFAGAVVASGGVAYFAGIRTFERDRGCRIVVTTSGRNFREIDTMRVSMESVARVP